MGTFIATVFGLCAAVGTIYPDKLSAPKTYPDGLEAELGGKGAMLVSIFGNVGNYR
jgi:NADH dehydrogenase (ubiquinone) 1 beta subcomplex subunit 8